jgi:hypothetical protein
MAIANKKLVSFYKKEDVFSSTTRWGHWPLYKHTHKAKVYKWYWILALLTYYCSIGWKSSIRWNLPVPPPFSFLAHHWNLCFFTEVIPYSIHRQLQCIVQLSPPPLPYICKTSKPTITCYPPHFLQISNSIQQILQSIGSN